MYFHYRCPLCGRFLSLRYLMMLRPTLAWVTEKEPKRGIGGGAGSRVVAHMPPREVAAKLPLVFGKLRDVILQILGRLGSAGLITRVDLRRAKVEEWFRRLGVAISGRYAIVDHGYVLSVGHDRSQEEEIYLAPGKAVAPGHQFARGEDINL